MTKKIISGINEDEVWQQIEKDLTRNPDLLDYRAIIEQQKRKIFLEIDIDLGGGFESGYSTTTLHAPLQTEQDFRFAIHKEDFLDDIGKFFGMQDVEIGYPEFDKKLVIKTNDESRVKQVFSDRSVRELFKSLNDFTFGITKHTIPDSNYKGAFLELIIEDGITDPDHLRKIYHAFFNTLILIDPV